jgi:hypothetical protein
MREHINSRLDSVETTDFLALGIALTSLAYPVRLV